MYERTFTHNGKTYRRIDKRTAEILIKDKAIWMCPCKMRLFGMWSMGLCIDSSSGNFNELVNMFEYYNCNSETGKYAAFYVEE